MSKKKNKKDKSEEVAEVGFSDIGGFDAKRSINRDGSFNVVKSGNYSFLKDLFHYLISINLLRLLLILVLYYVTINSIFAIIYYSMGSGNLSIAGYTTGVPEFYDCLFFSFQTFATVGYGYISPASPLANIVVVVEIFFGMLSVALLAGLVYSRFSMPNTRILFSNNILFHEKDPDHTTLKFKLVNKRNSIMIDTEVIVTVALRGPKNKALKYRNLNLEVNRITFLPLTWTVHHVIDSKSPLRVISKENFKELNPEILIRVKGFDDKYHQYVYANFSYHIEDWVWNKKFERNFWRGKDGVMHLDVNDVHKYS